MAAIRRRAQASSGKASRQPAASTTAAQLDRHHGQQEPERGLQGERGPDRVPRGRLRHHRAELGRVGDDEEAPDQDERSQQPEALAVEESGRQGAQPARRHRPDHHSGVPRPLRRPSAPERAEPACGDGAEGRQVHQRGRHDVARNGARRGARREGGDPGPHRAQLPHAPQVPGGRDSPPGRAIVATSRQEKGRRGTRAARPGSPPPRAGRPGSRRRRSSRTVRSAHVGGADQVGQRFPTVSADDGPDREPAVVTEPGGGHLMAGG
jgi:hypothetical protein